MCLGCLFLPLALVMLGYNEKDYVCNMHNILYTESNAEVVGCDHTQFADDPIVYFSCAINKDSLPTWTPAELGAAGLGNAISFRSAAGAQRATMLQCVESARTAKEGNRKYTVYSYKLDWMDVPIDSTGFSKTQQALDAVRMGCPGFQGNPPWPTNIEQSTEMEMAQSLKAGSFIISHELLKGGKGGIDGGLKPDMTRPIPLTEFSNAALAPASSLPQAPSSSGFTSITSSQVAVGVGGNELVTCSEPMKVGCMRIQYFQNWDSHASAVAAVDTVGNTKPFHVDSSWGCKGDDFSALEVGSYNLPDFVSRLHESNQARTWMIRICGILAAWLAVFCCLQPIAAAADVLGDCLNFVPCIGNFLEDMVEGMVTGVLCIVSCGVGVSCALLVIALAWLAMRPMLGGLLIFLCVALFCCANAIAQHFKGERRHRMEDMEMATGLKQPTRSDGYY